ncbi:hypothetical protein WB904_004326 [Vibrio parahaemolyticus]|nr:hypothetical protein [Vibrio parahaemolyticus]EIA1769022.1 hypothetical protein [Vibrio parahaemolyticus]
MKKLPILLVSLLCSANLYAEEPITILNSTVVPSGVTKDVHFIEGDAVNNSSTTFDMVFVTINLYKNHVLIGNTVSQISNLEPSQLWHFKASAVGDFDEYKVSQISTY